MKKPVSVPQNRLMVLGISLMLMLAFTAPVGAADSNGVGEVMTVSGNSEPSDCNNDEGVGAIYLTGDVEGCLTFFPSDFSCDELNGYDRYRESGTETFDGSLHGEPGKFTTTYTLEATYAPGFCDGVNAGGFPFELQLTGGCDHAVTGTEGSFAGITGLITFFDVIPNPGVSGASNFFYAGDLERSTSSAVETLMYGTNADRSGGAELDGSAVSGRLYVWLSPLSPVDVDSIAYVDYYVNGTFRHREWKAPYDMIGGGDNAATDSWNTAEVSNGANTVTAVITLKDGTTRTVGATFDVAN